MARMRVYTVHINPSKPYPYEAAQFVPEGFNWKAFLFSSLWALYKRLWMPAVLLICYNIIMAYLVYGHVFSHTGISIIDFGGHLVIGFHANDWVRARLARRGYLTADITAGESGLRAEQRFFDRYFPAPVAAA
jgi:hypothetical protein